MRYRSDDRADACGALGSQRAKSDRTYHPAPLHIHVHLRGGKASLPFTSTADRILVELGSMKAVPIIVMVTAACGGERMITTSCHMWVRFKPTHESTNSLDGREPEPWDALMNCAAARSVKLLPTKLTTIGSEGATVLAAVK